MSFLFNRLQRRQVMLAMASGFLAPELMAQAARQARLVVIGGAEDRMQDRVILRKFVDYCGGTASRIRLITAASGAVGSAFGALAKARGCRVVGIAGGKDKCDYVVKELGFDACIDYKEHKDYISLSKALREACPNGIDGHFENVGGMVLDAVMLRTNAFARIAVCGMIAGYDGAPLPMSNPALILVNRMKIEGFIVSEHMEVWPEALKELGTLVGTGKLRPRESVAQGLAAAPEAFLGLLKGKNFGKQLVKLI